MSLDCKAEETTLGEQCPKVVAERTPPSQDSSFANRALGFYLSYPTQAASQWLAPPTTGWLLFPHFVDLSAKHPQVRSELYISYSTQTDLSQLAVTVVFILWK